MLLPLLAGVPAQTQTLPFPASSLTPTVLHFADGGDQPGRMTTDAAGNLYIAAGLSFLSNKPTFAVLKYSFDGKTLKTFREVRQPGEFGGTANAVKLDAQGNLYVVGLSSLGGIVVSFAPGGRQRWSTCVDSIHASFDATSVVLDAAANVYVGGISIQPGNGIEEWMVAKYSSTGKELWIQHHVGKQEGRNLLTDIALDASGNIFAIGSTDNVGAFLKRDFTVIKYDTNGNEVFDRDFTATPLSDQEPGALAVDHAGNVYVTLLSLPSGIEGDHIPVTLKYDPTGKLLFTLMGDGIGGSSVSLDANGNVLLAGSAVHPGPNPPVVTAAKFTSAGAKVWIKPVLGAGKVVSDQSGNVYVSASVGATPGNYFVTKLTPQGKPVFQFRFSPGNIITDTLVDPFGNFVMTGEGENANFDEDIFTVRLPRTSLSLSESSQQ
jgi:hypothetical protein